MITIKLGSIEIPEDKFNEIALAHGYVKKEEKKTVPRVGDAYYFLSSSGGIDSCKWDTYDYDNRRLVFGNVFLSEAEAQKAKEKQLATVRVINKIAELNNGDVLDWGDTTQRKTFFYITDGSIECGCSYGSRFLDKTRYLVREVDAEFMIETMADDIKLMLGVG